MGDNDNEFEELDDELLDLEPEEVPEEIEEKLEELEEVLEDLDELLEDEEEEVIEEVIEEIEELFEEYVIEYDPKGDPVIPHREHNWGENVRVIQGEWAERILNNANDRPQNIYHKVAFVGHHRQNRFIAYLAAKMLVRGNNDDSGGILFVPVELADYGPLQELDRLEDAPEGFVAFRAK